MVEVRQAVLGKNDLLAQELRRTFRDAGVYVVSLVSSPGSGKTTLLHETLRQLMGRYRVASLVGDLATEIDAERLRETGARVRQITTGSVCHLDAEMVRKALVGWTLAEIDFLFIENVGNLVCPAGYDLGEDLRAVLLSVTEGEDKPRKYPTIFSTADLTVITKIDLSDAVDYDWVLASRYLDEVGSGRDALQLSAKSGDGVETWLRRLESGLSQKRNTSTPAASPAIASSHPRLPRGAPP